MGSHLRGRIALPADGGEARPPDSIGGRPVDGRIYEEIRVRRGRIEFLELHLQRLIGSASALGLPLPRDTARLTDDAERAARACGLPDAVLRLTLEPRGGEASVDWTARPFTAPPSRAMVEGFRLITALQRRDERAPLARHKARVRVDRDLARAEAERAGADEALVLNTRGRVAGASSASLFLILGRVLVTPAIEEGGFPGVMRRVAIRAARDLGMAVEEREVEPAELHRTPEVFLTSSLIGLAAVAAIDGVDLPPPARRGAMIPRLRIRVRQLAEAGVDPTGPGGV